MDARRRRDAAAMTRSIPIEKALDDACSPMRRTASGCGRAGLSASAVFLPGYEGNTNVKWIRRLKLGTAPLNARGNSKYRMRMPDGTARQFNFVMEAKSVITLPSGGRRLERRIQRNLRHRLDGIWQVPHSSSVDRRWRLMTRCRSCKSRSCPVLTRFARTGNGMAGRRRWRAASPTRRATPVTREALMKVRDILSLLSFQWDSELERRDGRRGDQCGLKSLAPPSMPR